MAFWDFIEELKKRHFHEHMEKIKEMYVREMKPVTVRFKGADKDSAAVCLKVVNKASSSGGPSLHNVLIAQKPGEKHLRIWCGDFKVAKEDGEKEGRCNFWLKHRKNGEAVSYACKHIVFAVSNLSEKDREQINKMLQIDESFFAPGSFDFILDLWEPALIYGPTGSGKSHEVRQLLRKYTATNPDIRTAKIRITDALEDVDALQKIMPAEDGSGSLKRIVGELRQVFDIAQTRKTVLVLEELTRSSRPFRNLLIHALDPNDGEYELHDITTGEIVRAPVSNLLYIATANLAYDDTSALDPALARRFTFNIFYDYDVNKERKLLKERVTEKTADKILKTAKAIRDQYRAGRLPYPLDTGSLIKWADLIKKGLDYKDAALKTWVFRVVEKDTLGYPETGQIEAIVGLLQEGG